MFLLIDSRKYIPTGVRLWYVLADSSGNVRKGSKKNLDFRPYTALIWAFVGTSSRHNYKNNLPGYTRVESQVSHFKSVPLRVYVLRSIPDHCTLHRWDLLIIKSLWLGSAINPTGNNIMTSLLICGIRCVRRRGNSWGLRHGPWGHTFISAILHG